MGSYREAVSATVRPADIRATWEYRHKYGLGFNPELEIAKHLGVFCRLSWSDGQMGGWTLAEVDRTVTAGVSIQGEKWHRPNDTFAVAAGITVPPVSNWHSLLREAPGSSRMKER